MISTITKRDGRTVTFNLEKITNAIAKALRVTGEADEAKALSLAILVAEKTERSLATGNAPTVEEIQDIVETVGRLEKVCATRAWDKPHYHQRAAVT